MNIERVKAAKYRVLCIDGGGAAGGVAASFLHRLSITTATPVHKMFDMISGASTGAIIGACLAHAVPAVLVKQFYLDVSKYFCRNWLPPFPLAPKYKKQPIVTMLNKLIGDEALGLALTYLQIASVERTTDDNVYFKSWKPEWTGLPTVEAVTRSFSAAVYFGQTVDLVNKKVYVDGGEGNGNCTLQECINDVKKLGWHKDGCYIMSLGTGHAAGLEDFNKIKNDSVAVGQTLEYMNLARRQAVRTQVYSAECDTLVLPGLDFDRFDPVIPDKLDVLAGTEYAAQYAAIGEILFHQAVAPGPKQSLYPELLRR